MKSVLGLLRASYGLDPTRGGMARVLARHVEARCSALGLDEAAYVERLQTDSDEHERLIHAATVRHSWFYRDPGQIDGLGELLQARHAAEPDRRLELWVAGCALGEEPWTVAMVADELGLPLRILATDVDKLAVADAQLGRYSSWSLRELPRRLWPYMSPAGEGRWRVDDALRGRVEFVAHNLCDPAPAGRFDVICCRNVLIYFEPDRAHGVVARLRESLRPGGRLLLGAGDHMFQLAVDRSAKARSSRPAAAASPARAQTPIRVKPVPAPAPAPAPATPRPKIDRPMLPARVTSTSDQSVSTLVGRLDQREEVLVRASEAVEAGDYERAIEMLTALVEHNPLLAEAHLWSGIAHHALGQDRAAGEALRRARCLAPQLWPATLFAALNNERRGRWEPAVRCWSELERTVEMVGVPAIVGTSTLLAALPRWRGEAMALARQRNTKGSDDGSGS